MTTNTTKQSHFIDYIHFGRWVQAPLSGYFWTKWHTANSIEEIMGEKAMAPLLFLDGHTFVHKKQQQRYRKHLEHLIEKKGVRSFRKKCERIALRCENRHRASLKAKLPSDKHAIELFDSYLEMAGVWALFLQLSPILEKIVRDLRIATEDELVDLIEPHRRRTDIEKQSEEIRKLASQRKHTRFHAKARDHVERFVWFGTHHWEGEGYSIEKCLRDIDRVAIESKKVKIKKKKSVAHEEVWKLLACFMYWRTHCAETTAEVVFRSRTQLTKLAARWDMSYDELLLLTSDEILEAINGRALTPKDIAARKEHYGIDVTTGEIITGATLNAHLKHSLTSEEFISKEIRGSVASKGSAVTGIARIVLSPKDFQNFREGDVLIAPETTPDFVPLMKLASAIITDTGGLTSHAAIIARELRKPCIVGTKVASRMLADGEMVEIDMTSGVVRKISN